MRIPFFSCLLLMFLFVSWVSGQCRNDQRSLLLQLNSSLAYDPSISTKLARWSRNLDCCRWDGVECDSSGHVIGLELDNETITGGIEKSTALFSFQFLEKLNLAYNSFTGSFPIPKDIRNLTNLANLNLSNAGFGGQIPIQLSEMTSLVTLDLSSQFQGQIPLNLSDPNLKTFIRNLTNLQALYLDGVIISDQGDWWQDLSLSLPNLRNLSLRHCNLSGPLDGSFTQLQPLSVLRLDRNNLSTTALDLFANFRNLTILTLSFCSLQGSFPETIFQVNTLQYLDLSNNGLLTGTIPELPLGGSLRTLALSYSNFSGSLPDSIGNLSMLSMIELSNCNFSGVIPSTIGELSELILLDFSVNLFSGSIPVFNMSKKLTYIDLSQNGLNGSLSPTHFAGLSNLLFLNLGSNSLTGSIPSSLFGLPSLQKLMLSNNKFSRVNEFSPLNSTLDTLDLISNQLEGPIPESFFKLNRLNVLLLSFNSFNGTLELKKIQSLQNLTNLGLAYNNLSVDASSSNSDLPLFPQLSRLNLAACNLNSFPNLTNQSRLTTLDLSNNNISGDIPSWIWTIGNGFLVHLNLSCNSLMNVQMPYRIPSSLSVLDLHLNMLRGELPLPPASPVYLDYSRNNFQGTFPIDIGINISLASFFSVASNGLTGEIPVSFCNATYLQVLDLSGNYLSGGIPNCLAQNLMNLGVLNLGRNNINGNIPDTFSVNCGLKTLDLSRNKLEGNIPASLANCKLLEVMNVGSNNINDRFPCILKNSSSLRVLVLRANQFYGDIKCPGVNETWPNLQIIDIAFNRFTGYLYPKCISSWTGMKLDNGQQLMQNHLHFSFLYLNNLYYQDTVTVTIKGLELELLKILTVFTSIDFSGNKFQGEIPDTIGELSSLYVLNLSHNSFTGTIPKSVGNLMQLGSLDLSVNQLTGEIPGELTSLTFLSFFNVSYNKLVGRIPTGSQFQTFSAESYEGNTGLCGFPLNRSCDTNEPSETSANRIGQIDLDWQFIFTGLGYGAGAALIIAPLAFSKKWRERCDGFQDKLLKLIYPGYGFSYIRYDGKVEDPQKVDDESTDDDEEEEDEDVTKVESSRGRYCVFCTKLDYQIKMAMHNPKCTCYFSPPTFSYSPTSSSSSSLLVMYHQKF